MRIVEAVIGSGVAVPPIVNLSLGMDSLPLLLDTEDGSFPITIYLSDK